MPTGSPLYSVDSKTLIRSSSRERLCSALAHHDPYRVPVDLLATPQVFDGLIASLPISALPPPEDDLFDPQREAILRYFDVDCRVVSQDTFCAPPDSVLAPGSVVDWWGHESLNAGAHVALPRAGRFSQGCLGNTLSSATQEGVIG